MVTQEQIAQQQKLLSIHRQTLAVYLARLAHQSFAHVDPEAVHGIREARRQIARIKGILRDWGIPVDDGADDEEDAAISSELSSRQPVASTVPIGIPDDRYYPLPGRERLITSIVDALVDRQGPAMIVISGLGGLGKTAAAAEVSRRLIRNNQFEAVMGESAKIQQFLGGTIVPLQTASLDFDALLDSIARQLGRWEIPTLKAAEKRAVLGRIFQQQHYLLLIDNLETAENAQSLVVELRRHLGSSRALVTSRERVADDAVQSFLLSEFDADDSISFIQADAAQRGIEQLINAPRDLLLDIHHATGGAPLALKLVVAQTRFFAIDLVLSQLRTQGAQLYTYIYRRAWEQLTPTAQRVLIYIGQTVVTTVSWAELHAVALAENDQELIAALDQLFAYSLLNAVSSNGTIRYGVHQLTRQFVRTGLPELWREQGLE